MDIICQKRWLKKRIKLGCKNKIFEKLKLDFLKRIDEQESDSHQWRTMNIY